MIITNKNNLPKVFENAVKSFQRDYTNESRFSITDLLKSPYMLNLEKKYHTEIKEDVIDRIWALLGSALHEVLKKSNTAKNMLIEERLKIEIDDVEISGQFDCFCDNGILYDYKLTSVWKIIYTDFSEWEKQLNCYAYLLSKYNFDVKKIKIIAILKDFSKLEKLRINDYPQNEIVEIELKLWNFEEQEKFIKERLKKHLDKNIDICNSDERWHKEDKFAVMKKSRKTAIRVFNLEDEAKNLLNTLDDNYYIEYRKGEDIRCKNYCRVKNFCEYYKGAMNEN